MNFSKMKITPSNVVVVKRSSHALLYAPTVFAKNTTLISILWHRKIPRLLPV
jgi:hypothetical protein